MRRMRLPLLAGLALLLTGGCRNPFEPSSDIELARLQSNGTGSGATILVHANDAAQTQLNLNLWKVSVRVVIRNKVDVYLTSASITYTDYDGNEVTSYRSIGGRNLKFTVFCRGVTDDTAFGETEGAAKDFDLYVVDANVIRELRSPSYPDTNVMFANIVIRGEDANGYDVRLEGQITIQYIE